MGLRMVLGVVEYSEARKFNIVEKALPRIPEHGVLVSHKQHGQ